MSGPAHCLKRERLGNWNFRFGSFLLFDIVGWKGDVDGGLVIIIYISEMVR
jgi:hypothetical protein